MDVLVIEDDIGARRLMTKVLERSGFGVATADNGLAAYAELQEQEFAAIACDIKLPYLEGRTFYGELAADFPEMADRVFFVSGLPEPELREFARRVGRPYLCKPYAVADFIAMVRHIAAQAHTPAPTPAVTE